MDIKNYNQDSKILKNKKEKGTIKIHLKMAKTITKIMYLFNKMV